jgi:hypothetical protein
MGLLLLGAMLLDRESQLMNALALAVISTALVASATLIADH